MTPLSNNNPPQPPKRVASNESPQRPKKYLKNEEGNKVAMTSELSTKIIEESNSPDRMEVVQDHAISSSVSSLVRMASQPSDLSVSAHEFIKSIKEKEENLADLIQSLISQGVISTVLTEIPWHELDDTQKNNLFSCLFKIIPHNDYLRRIIGSLIPTTAQDYVPILPLNPTALVYMGLHSYFPAVFKAYVRLVINYSSADVFFIPSDAISVRMGGLNHFIQLPKELATTIKKELPLFFKKIPLNFPLPHSIENYFFSYLGNFFGKYRFDLPQLASATALDYLTHCHPYDSFEFDRFYKSAGPFACSRAEKIKLQDPRLALFWKNYLYLSFKDSSEGFLIEKEELLRLEYFKKKNEFKPIDPQDIYQEMEFGHQEFLPTDFFYFFKAIRFHQMPKLDFQTLLRLLNLADRLCCLKLKQLIETHILTEIPHLDIDLESLLNLLGYTYCSEAVKQAVQELVWKINPALIQNPGQLAALKDYLEFLPADLPSEWSRLIPELAENIPSASFLQDHFHQRRHFKNLKSIQLDQCTLSQSLFTRFSSVKTVEINGWKGPLEAPKEPLLWEKVKLIQSPSDAPVRFGIELTRFPVDLLRALKKVTHLEIESDCNALFSAIESLKTLEHLSIKSLNTIEFSSLHQCLVHLPNLKSLSLAGQVRFKDLNQPLPSIENLSLSFPIPYGMLGLFPHVKRLSLVTESFETVLLEIKSLEKLEELKIIEEPAKSLSGTFQMTANRVFINTQPGFNRENALTGLSFNFGDLKNLRKIHFSIHQKVDPLMLASLAASVNLQDIALVSKQNFSKETYLEIIKKPNLARFSFSKPESLFQLSSIYAYALEKRIELDLL